MYWNALPPLRSLMVFDAVVRRGGMAAAARELTVSAPAISQAIRTLEQDLGTALFDRTTRPAALTEEGRRFHRTVVEALDRISEEADRLRHPSFQDNTVTITCNLGFATYWLMPRLNAFHDQSPGLFVNVMTAYQGVASLRPGIDIAIAYGDESQGRFLFGEVITPVCSPGYLEKTGPIHNQQDLATRNLLHVDAEDRRWFDWKRYFQRQGLQPPSRIPGTHYGNYVHATQAALSDSGILLGWISTAGDLLESGQLVPALPDGAIPAGGGYVLTASSQRPVVDQLVQWLIETALNPPPA